MRLTIFLTVLSMALSVPSLVTAQAPQAAPAKPIGENNAVDPTADPTGDKAEFIAGLEDIELQISEQERYGEYGHAELKRYVQELEKEFFANEDDLEKLSDSKVAEAILRRRGLTARQQHISLLLWQLKRVGGQIGQQGFNSHTLTTQAHKLLAEYRTVMRDVDLMKRFQSVTRRLSDLSRAKITNSQLRFSFRFVRPTRPSSERNVGLAVPRIENTGGLPIGPIQTLTESIGNLVQLSWKDGSLAWDETHWETPFAGYTLEAIEQQVEAELRQRNIELPEEDRIAAQRKKSLHATARPILLFQDLQHLASQGRPPSRSYSTSGSSARSRFTAGEIEAAIVVSPQKTEFTISESSGPNRTFFVRREGDNSMRISLIGEHILLLEQNADGTVRWVSIGSDVIVEKAGSFAELYAKHADRIEKELFSRLRHCGAGTPMTRYEIELVGRVLDRLQGVDRKTQERFHELVGQIDSGNFGERQKAYRELSADVETYSLLLAETSDEDGRSPEASARLAELRKISNDQFHQLDSLIDTTGWLTDPGYLIGLAQRVGEGQAELVSRQLKAITGQSFGQDWARWREWISK